jgi:DNA gyrase/topoisomerase IV subunit B
VSFDVDTIRTRLREVAFLNRTATITFETRGASGSSSNGSGSKGSSPSNGNGTGGHAAAPETFHFSGGIAEFVAWNNRARHTMHEPIFISRVVRNQASTACYASAPSCIRHLRTVSSATIASVPTLFVLVMSSICSLQCAE